MRCANGEDLHRLAKMMFKLIFITSALLKFTYSATFVALTDRDLELAFDGKPGALPVVSTKQGKSGDNDDDNNRKYAFGNGQYGNMKYNKDQYQSQPRVYPKSDFESGSLYHQGSTDDEYSYQQKFSPKNPTNDGYIYQSQNMKMPKDDYNYQYQKTNPTNYAHSQKSQKMNPTNFDDYTYQYEQSGPTNVAYSQQKTNHKNDGYAYQSQKNNPSNIAYSQESLKKNPAYDGYVYQSQKSSPTNVDYTYQQSQKMYPKNDGYAYQNQKSSPTNGAAYSQESYKASPPNDGYVHQSQKSNSKYKTDDYSSLSDEYYNPGEKRYQQVKTGNGKQQFQGKQTQYMKPQKQIDNEYYDQGNSKYSSASKNQNVGYTRASSNEDSMYYNYENKQDGKVQSSQYPGEVYYSEPIKNFAHKIQSEQKYQHAGKEYYVSKGNMKLEDLPEMAHNGQQLQLIRENKKRLSTQSADQRY